MTFSTKVQIKDSHQNENFTTIDTLQIQIKKQTKNSTEIHIKILSKTRNLLQSTIVILENQIIIKNQQKTVIIDPTNISQSNSLPYPQRNQNSHKKKKKKKKKFYTTCN